MSSLNDLKNLKKYRFSISKHVDTDKHNFKDTALLH
jgi:hypothetical protein